MRLCSRTSDFSIITGSSTRDEISDRSWCDRLMRSILPTISVVEIPSVRGTAKYFPMYKYMFLNIWLEINDIAYYCKYLDDIVILLKTQEEKREKV